MNHDEAVIARAASRYAQNKLSHAEREAFEEHFFDCKICSGRVSFEVKLLANIRQAMQAPFPEPQFVPSSAPELSSLQAGQAGIRKEWPKWLRLRPALAVSLAANLVLFAGIAYVLFERTHEVGGPQLRAAYFAPGPAHGADLVHPISAGEKYYLVRFIASAQKSQSYAYEVLDQAGDRELSGSLTTPPAEDDFLYLQIPVENLPAGVYTLSVRGVPGDEIVSWSRFQTSR
ncbi:MAG TPA: hypothetical protein VMR62_18800 [Bryobacteraceae bacterium]|jgi:hypothetical protein|nr:hypothetical protein [Bryobacteraceae bacterium]